MMNLDALIEKLQDLRTEIEMSLGENVAEEAIVRLAIQPNYPMQHDISEYSDFVYDTQESRNGEQRTVVYIPEGGQVYDAPYLPGEVSEQLGWR